ncbi:sensor histidine kinase [Bacillota bacterium Lsc_1132]
MPIRLRLTLWNSAIFGTILAIIISLIYYAHYRSHYEDVDMMLGTITSHVHEELNKQLNNGKKLENIQVSTDELGINQVAVMIRNRTGKLIDTNDHPFFRDHQLIWKNLSTKDGTYMTVTDNTGKRVRVLTTLIHQNDKVVGFIQTLYPLKELDQSLLKFKWLVIGLTVFSIVLASIAALFLVKKILSRVDLVRKTANAIAVSQDFQQRVMHTGPSDELGKLAETFNSMLESLEKAYTNQKRFLSDASHELRAPLTTIRGNLDILTNIKNIPEAEKEEILMDIRNEAIRMSKLVSDLLSLARVEAGQVGNKKFVCLSAIAKGVIAEIVSWEKQIKVKSQIDDHVCVWGDEDSLKQLIIILVDNAIKYTPPSGSILIKITDENEKAVIRVKDTGIGIDAGELPYIFERFYRTDSARRYSQDGTGLGLAIAKSIVEEHQGSILVNSNVREGTEFAISFPLIK